jgi:hypothetical protein
MSYRKNDANGLRTDEEHKVSVEKFTDFESKMAPVVRMTIKDRWGDQFDIGDHGVDNTGGHISSDDEFKQLGGGAFDWVLTGGGKTLIIDAQVHTAFCNCITLKHDKLVKAANQNYAILIIEERGFVWLRAEACGHIVNVELNECQSTLGDKMGYRFNTGRINFAIKKGWANYIPYSEKALALVDAACFPKHYSDTPRAYVQSS